jgi:hypothetical protein
MSNSSFIDKERLNSPKIIFYSHPLNLLQRDYLKFERKTLGEKKMHKYLFLFLVHTAFAYSLNCVNKIWQCAAIFALLVLLTSFITHAYGAKKAVRTVFLSTFLSLILSLNKTYFIQGEPISGLFFASYLSILISCTSSTFFFSYLMKKEGFSIPSSSALTVFFTAFFDGIMMAGFFIHLYPMARITDIFLQEVGFKSLYAGIAYVVLRGIVAAPKALAFLKDAKKSEPLPQRN